MNEWYLLKKLIYLITIVTVVVVYVTISGPNRRSNTIINRGAIYVPSKLFQKMSRSIELISIEPIDDLFPSKLSFAVFENRSNYLTERLGVTNAFHFIYSDDPRLFTNSRGSSVRQPVLTNVIFCDRNVLVRIAILVRRHGYFWIGSANSSYLSSLDCDENQLDQKSQHPMAIDEFLLEGLQPTYSFGLRLFVVGEESKGPLKAHLPHSRFLDCDYENLVWPFYEKYETEPIDHWELTKVLRTFRRLTVTNQIPLVLMFGSILGWYRQCGYIEHSYDVDFAANITQLDEKLFRLLFLTDTSKITERYGSLSEGPMEWVSYGLSMLSLTKVDVFGLAPTESGNGIYYDSYVRRNRKRFRYVYPNFSLSNLCSLEFEGVLLYALCDPSRSILIEYGTEWFEPKTLFMAKNLQSKMNLTDQQMKNDYHIYKTHNCPDPSILKGCDANETTDDGKMPDYVF